jgi:hypothetical protein
MQASELSRAAGVSLDLRMLFLRNEMKIFVSIVAAAVSLTVLGSAIEAQAPTEQPAATTRSINLTVENRHVIKEIVKDLHVQNAPDNVALTVGATVPQSMVRPLPEQVAVKVPQVKSHVFFVKDDKIVLVDPKENKIVEVIE